MDFARIDPRRDAERGATYHVMYVTDRDSETGEPIGERLYNDGKPIEMDFLGLDSAAGRRAAAQMVRDMDRKVGGKKRSAKDMSVDEILATATENEQVRAQFYAALVTGWRNVVYLDDDKMDDPNAKPAELAFSEANAVKLFSTRPWIMEGIDAFLADKGNFGRKARKG